MGNRTSDCSCSILSAREEKLLDDEGRIQVRLICNRCSRVLDSEVMPLTAHSSERFDPRSRIARGPGSRAAETETAEGS